MLDQARSAQGKRDPRLSATFAQREHDITRGTAFFSPRISMMVLFFVQGSSKLINAKLLTAISRVRHPTSCEK